MSNFGIARMPILKSRSFLLSVYVANHYSPERLKQLKRKRLSNDRMSIFFLNVIPFAWRLPSCEFCQPPVGDRNFRPKSAMLLKKSNVPPAAGFLPGESIPLAVIIVVTVVVIPYKIVVEFSI